MGWYPQSTWGRVNRSKTGMNGTKPNRTNRSPSASMAGNRSAPGAASTLGRGGEVGSDRITRVNRHPLPCQCSGWQRNCTSDGSEPRRERDFSLHAHPPEIPGWITPRIRSLCKVCPRNRTSRKRPRRDILTWLSWRRFLRKQRRGVGGRRCREGARGGCPRRLEIQAAYEDLPLGHLLLRHYVRP